MDSSNSIQDKPTMSHRILLKPLYRYRYGKNNSDLKHPPDADKNNGMNYNNSNDYRVIQRLVSPSHELEWFHSNAFLGNQEDHRSQDNSGNSNGNGELGEVEVTIEEYCGPLRNYSQGNGINGCETLWRRVAVRGAGGSVLHRTFALPANSNDSFGAHNNSSSISQLFDLTSPQSDNPLASNNPIYQDPIMCWTSFSVSGGLNNNSSSSSGDFYGQSFPQKRHLCVLALPSLLRIFDLQPSSFPQPQFVQSNNSHDNNHTHTSNKSRKAQEKSQPSHSTFRTEGGEGHVVSLPFEASSIFSIQMNYRDKYNKNECNNDIGGGLLLQRMATQEDYFAWNQFQDTHFPTIQYTQSHEEAFKNFKTDEKSNEGDDDDEYDEGCAISDPPHPVRLGNVFETDLPVQQEQIQIPTSTQPQYYDDNPNYQFQFSSSSVTSLFSIRHPLDEIRPIALLPPHFSSHYVSSSSSSSVHPSTPLPPPTIPPLFADAHEQVLFLGCPQYNTGLSTSSSSSSFKPNLPNICVTYHTQIKRHAVWIFKKAPPPLPVTPLWQRAATANAKRVTSQTSKTNTERNNGIFSSNTGNSTTSSAVFPSVTQTDEKLDLPEVDGHTNTTNSSSPFLDIHPDYGLSLLWTEEPFAMMNYENEIEKQYHSHLETSPIFPTNTSIKTERKCTTSIGRAQNVFLASDIHKNLSYICLVCPNKKMNRPHSQIDPNQVEPQNQSQNPFILRCLSINFLEERHKHSKGDEKRKPDHDPSFFIQNISHKMDLPCVSAQPIYSSNAVDILVCSIDTAHLQENDLNELKDKKKEKYLLKLYRGDYFLCDCDLPLGGSFGWSSIGMRIDENMKEELGLSGKKTSKGLSKKKGGIRTSASNATKPNTSIVKGILSPSDCEVKDVGNVINLSLPIHDRIDTICKPPENPLVSLNSEYSHFTVRSSLSLCISSSPLAEAALVAIELSQSIPPEFSLKLRVDCIQILQNIPYLCSMSKQYGKMYSFMDPGWTAVSTVIMAILKRFVDQRNSSNANSNVDMDISYQNNYSHLTERSEADDSDDDWDFLLQSEFHEIYSRENAALFEFEQYTSNPNNNKNYSSKNLMSSSSPDEDNLELDRLLSSLSCLSIVNTPITLELCSSIFDALHLLYEDAKLCRNSRGEDWIYPLGALLTEIAKRSNGGMNDFLDHFSRDLGPECNLRYVGMSNAFFESADSCRYSTFSKPPSFFAWIDFMLRGYSLEEDSKETAYFTTPPNVLNRACIHTGKIHRLYSILFNPSNLDPGIMLANLSVSNPDDESKRLPVSSRKKDTRYRDQRLVLAMVDEGFTNLSDLIDELPIGIILPLMESLHRCRDDPPQSSSNWPPAAYQLIGRSDLAEMESIKRGLKEAPKSSGLSARYRGSRGVEGSSSSGIPTNAQSDPEKDGLVPLETFSSMIFPQDRRVREAARLLRSSRPTFLRVDRAPEVSDHDHEGFKQDKLLLLCRRVLANPLGRGMLTIGTMQPVLAEPLPIPDLCLVGRVPPTNATLNLDISNCPPDMKIWPEFHNGVAAGLRISIQENKGQKGGINQITRTWILYNKPTTQSANTASSQNRNAPNINSNSRNSERTDHSHGGLLMALGLRGHLSSLAMTDIYEYLTQGGVTTTVGILLGMAATKRSSCDPSVSKMLCLHIPSLLPPSFSAMEVASAAQAAAIAGIGLLYQGSSHRLMTEFLLNEMGRKPTSDYSTHDREGYTLACGLALGMVNLNIGESNGNKNKQGMGAGLADLHIEERLHRYVVGGTDDIDTRLRREAAERSNAAGSNAGEPEKCSRIYEGSTINTDVTAPGATLALGLMFLKSGNRPVASSLSLPDTHFLLDYVRPDLLMLRVISRALILWDDVSPTAGWIDAQIPVVVRNSFDHLERQALKASDFRGLVEDTSKSKQEDIAVDRQAVRQAHAYIVAGACFGMGLRFAGTANSYAASAIAERVRLFRRLRDDNDPASLAQRPERPILEMCLGCAAISLAMVMAGTGDIDTLRLLRELRWRCDEDVRYGNHMALGAAIGLVFLGGGSCTLGTEPEDIAALLMAFFPRFPSHTSDNQYHLQALRHCYVLAVRNRELEAIDVDTREPVYIPMKVSGKKI